MPLPDVHSIDCVFKLWYFSGIVPTQLKGEDMLKFDGLFNKLRRPGIVLLLMAFTASATLGLSAAFGGFNQYEPPSQEARYQDLVALLSDGEFDSNLLQAELSDTDILSTSEYVRYVTLTAVLYFTEEEVLAALKVETMDEVPDNIRAGFNSDGLFPQTIAQAVFPSVLVNDFVIAPVALLSLNIPAEAAPRVDVEITLLPDQRVEDQWKQETIFKGTVEELIQSEGVYPDPDYGMVFLKRPSDKVILEPAGYPYDPASLDDIKPLNVVVFPRSFAGVAAVDSATVQAVLSDRGLIVLSGNFSSQDLGTPVFVLKDGKPQWAGTLVSAGNGTGVLVSVQTIKDRVSAAFR